MSVRSIALAAAAVVVALGSMTFAVSPVSARTCGDVEIASASGGPGIPGFRVSVAVD